VSPPEKVGARPGTLEIPAGSPPPRIYIMQYGPEGVREERELQDLSELSRYRDPSHATWIDVRGLGDVDILRAIGEAFELHPLALEDAVNVPQRSKTELYPNQHQLFISRAPLRDEAGRLHGAQVCIIFAQSYVLTFQERYFGFFDPVRERLRAGKGPIWQLGASYLAYALIDVLTDMYFPEVDQLTDELEELEEVSLEHPDPDVLARLHRVRRSLAVLRRIAEPQREAIKALVGAEDGFVLDEVRVFFRDTSDHIRQALGRIESAREFAMSLSEVNLSNLGHRSNEIMKVLTLMASIFIPLSFIAGLYGMNFEYIPELQYQFGYFITLASMVTIAGCMLGYFWRRGWIGSRVRRHSRSRR